MVRSLKIFYPFFPQKLLISRSKITLKILSRKQEAFSTKFFDQEVFVGKHIVNEKIVWNKMLKGNDNR